MPDQDVCTAPTATPLPAPGVGSPPHHAAPGADEDRSRAKGAGAVDDLRSEFSRRFSDARVRFTATVAEMRQAAEVMERDGRPPTYRLLHTLGECHREFLRLRHDVTGRARDLALPVPPLDKLAGLEDLASLLFTPAAAEPRDPTGSGTGPPTEYPRDEIGRLSLAPVPENSSSPAFGAIPDSSDPEATPPVTPSGCDRTPTPDSPAPALFRSTADGDHSFSGALASDDVPADRLATPAVPEPPDPSVPGPVPRPDPLTEDPAEVVRRAALAALDNVVRLGARDGTDDLPLKECQALALRLREAIAQSPANALPPEAPGLAAGTHALAGLLSLVGGVKSLSDVQWASAHASVSDSFGRPLAVAAARGRLHLLPS